MSANVESSLRRISINGAMHKSTQLNTQKKRKGLRRKRMKYRKAYFDNKKVSYGLEINRCVDIDFYADA